MLAFFIMLPSVIIFLLGFNVAQYAIEKKEIPIIKSVDKKEFDLIVELNQLKKEHFNLLKSRRDCRELLNNK